MICKPGSAITARTPQCLFENLEISPLWCCNTQAEKNLAWEAAQAQSQQMAALQKLGMAGMAGTGPAKLYVANLHAAMAVSASNQDRHDMSFWQTYASM